MRGGGEGRSEERQREGNEERQRQKGGRIE